jgi:hypothetical protein
MNCKPLNNWKLDVHVNNGIMSFGQKSIDLTSLSIGKTCFGQNRNKFKKDERALSITTFSISTLRIMIFCISIIKT